MKKVVLTQTNTQWGKDERWKRKNLSLPYEEFEKRINNDGSIHFYNSRENISFELSWNDLFQNRRHQSSNKAQKKCGLGRRKKYQISNEIQLKGWVREWLKKEKIEF